MSYPVPGRPNWRARNNPPPGSPHGNQSPDETAVHQPIGSMAPPRQSMDSTHVVPRMPPPGPPPLGPPPPGPYHAGPAWAPQQPSAPPRPTASAPPRQWIDQTGVGSVAALAESAGNRRRRLGDAQWGPSRESRWSGPGQDGVRTWLVVGVLAITAGLLTAALVAWVGTDSAASGPVWFAAGPGDSTAPAAPSGPPTRLRITSIGVDAPLQQIGLDTDGTLMAPTGYTQVGWFAQGPAPGDPGPAVLAGHVDSTDGPAVFARLPDLAPGALVEVERGQAWVRFTVVEVDTYRRTAFPTARVYGPTVGPELRLITCGGPFDKAAQSYRDNIVVYAVATGG